MSFIEKQQMVFINGGGTRKKLWGQAFTEISDVVARFSSRWSESMHFRGVSAKRFFYFAFI